jgi:hypothetical protein
LEVLAVLNEVVVREDDFPVDSYPLVEERLRKAGDSRDLKTWYYSGSALRLYDEMSF